MALHCVNYSLKTNERYINEMERSRPINDDDDQLIQSCFKEEYIIPIHNWALIQKDSKRNKLFNFLRCKSDTCKTREFKPINTSRRMPELVVQRPNVTIDFNRAIFGDANQRPMNKHKFESAGIKDGVFGYTRPYTAQPQSVVNYSLFIAKHLLVPSVVKRVAGACEQNEKLLNELLKWVEKKGNSYPVDPIRKHPELSPIVEGKLTKEKLSEDHIYSTTHRPLKVHPLTQSLRRRNAGKLDSFWSTNYMDNFCDDFHRGKMHPPDRLYKQVVSKQPPFALFPADGRPVEKAYNELIMQQSQTNRELGRTNYLIFNAKTCL